MLVSSSQKTLRLAQYAMMTAIIVILQCFSLIFSSLGLPVAISLVLVPIVVGAVLFGVRAGAYFGGVFGIVTMILGMTGLDPGSYVLFQASPLWFVVACMVKAVAAGAVAGAVYSLLHNKAHLNHFATVAIAAVTAPVVNTGIFLIFMFTAFRPTLYEWAGGADVWYYIITTLVGLNFLVEFILNLVLCPTISRLTKTVRTDHIGQ